MVTAKDICTAIAAGDCACVFIDDSGSQGQQQNIPHMPDDRFTWAGVITPPRFGERALAQMNGCLEYIEQEFGAKEFHFADVYAGTGEWRGVDFDHRIGIFRTFVSIFHQEGFLVFNQTLWHGNEILDKISTEFPKLNDKNLSDPKICSLFLLLVKIRVYLRERGWGQAIIVVDEGVQKSGSVLKIDGFAPEFKDGEIWFASSDSVVPLQLADFAAYTLNRWQVVSGKEKPSRADEAFLKAVDKIGELYQNVERIPLSLDTS